MKQFLFIILMSLFISQSSFAENLLSSVDRYKINENETIKLTVTLDDASFSGNPDLAGLDSHFQILSQRSSSSTTIINGSYNSKKEWHYTLLPKKTGKLLIPSFKLKNVFSDAIEIDVIANGDASQNRDLDSNSSVSQQGDLFLEQKIDKNEVFVQERITLTLQIFTAINIARPEIPDPALPNFMVEKIGQTEYQSKQNGKNYYVLEYKYALFPNKSGNAVLPKQRYQISQIVNNGSLSSFNIPGFNVPDTQTRLLSTSELSVTVKPQPDKIPASYWLPSEEVVITDNWPEQQTVDSGTPLTRTIEIKALGNLAAHLPALPIANIQGLKTYAEQAELTNTVTNDNFLATRKENIAIVPTQAGTYILPAVSLYWWDTKNKQFKNTVLPERTLIVNNSANATITDPPDNLSRTIAPSFVQPDSTIPLNNTLTPFYMNVYAWMGAALFFVILWIVTLIILVKIKNRDISNTKTISALEEIQKKSLKEKFKQLKSACQANDAIKVRGLLIDWAQSQWPDETILTLDQLKQRFENEQFSKLISELDGTLYRGAAIWDGKSLLNFFQSTQLPAVTAKETSLPKLYE